MPEPCGGNVDDRISTIGHECDRLVFLPALFFQYHVQPPLAIGIMDLNQSKIVARAVRRDRFAHGDFKMGLAFVT